MFSDQITAYLQTVNAAATRQAYHLSLSQFHTWYKTTYAEEPDAGLLTEEEGDQFFSGAGCAPGIVNSNDTVEYR